MRRQALLLGLSLSLGAWAQQVYQAQPTDDVWLYDNAFNPGFTPILRVWGNGQDAVDPIDPARPRSEFSYALAKWLLQGIPAGRQYQVLQAQITVVQTQPPGYTRAEGEQFPLEARDLSNTNFVEATWSYNTNTTSPGATIFGESLMTNYRTDAPFAIPIPLNAEAFEPYFNAAVNQNYGELGIGFVSRLDPAGQGGTRFYRFYSRNDGGGRGPVLQVVYRVAGDVNGDGCTDDADLLSVLFAFGETGANLPADLNGDGTIDDADLLEVLFNFGNGC